MSKELKALIRIEDLLNMLYETDVIDDDHTHDANIIGKALKRLEELEKAFRALSKEDEKAKELLSLEIEKNRVVDIIRAKLVDFNKLNGAEHNWKEDGCSSPVEYYNEGIVDYCQLTEEEYNFLVSMVGIRD